MIAPVDGKQNRLGKRLSKEKQGKERQRSKRTLFWKYIILKHTSRNRDWKAHESWEKQLI